MAGRGGGGVVMRDEPYSLRTSERLQLTSWKKLDFGPIELRARAPDVSSSATEGPVLGRRSVSPDGRAGP